MLSQVTAYFQHMKLCPHQNMLMFIYRLKHYNSWWNQRKRRTEKNVKLGKILFRYNLRSQNSHKFEKEEVVNFNSYKKIQHFCLINEQYTTLYLELMLHVLRNHVADLHQRKLKTSIKEWHFKQKYRSFCRKLLTSSGVFLTFLLISVNNFKQLEVANKVDYVAN